MQYHKNEKDWKLFKSKIPAWQERHMDKLNKEYIDILSGEGTPSEKFWSLEKRIKKDKNSAGVQINLSRSEYIFNIAELLRDEIITFDELDDFSEELKERIRFINGIQEY